MLFHDHYPCRQPDPDTLMDEFKYKKRDSSLCIACVKWKSLENLDSPIIQVIELSK